jgi:hypothetical protein
MSGYDLMAALDAIDPCMCAYEQWAEVGMALHHEGYPVDVWREWSARDAKRYNERDFESKWRGFGNNSGNPVTGGTIVKLAVDHGWRPVFTDDGGRVHHALSWDSTIGGGKHAAEDEPAIVDAASVGEFDADVSPMFPEGHEVEELRSFLKALFEPGEYIGYVCDYEAEERTDGSVKYKPGSRGVFNRTMGDVFDAVYKNGMENGLSCTLHDESGAWIRFNPLDGKGVGNANVAAFRFALLESDDMPQGKFAAIVKQLNLPVAALVDSGNKSLHAIVRIDAENANQYRERVDALYARCEKNGIAVDKQNKNASRLCRMPGVMRNGRRQYLAGLSQGAADWDEWEEWYAAETDELPDAVQLDSMLGENLPPLKPALIDGLLRVGHKMLVSGPSKAGKSFALIALCIAFAEGSTWFGFSCKKSRVMYVNLELDGDSCINRFNDMYGKLGYDRASAKEIDVWNLRGKSEPFGKLLPKLIRRCVKRGIEVVVLDPIYKIITGDENSAGDMAAFANLFDALCDQAGVSVIYCHHHSKGYQGGKRSIDRASGSGVFGRDPDAVLDIVEIEPDGGMRWKYINDKICGLCADAVASEGGTDAWMKLPDVARTIEANAIDNACAMLPDDKAAELKKQRDEIKAKEDELSAWRIEGTLREFPHFQPVNAWFDWPIHVMDDALKDCNEAGGEETAKPKKRKDQKPKKGIHGNEPIEDSAEVYREINKAIENAVKTCADDGVEPTRKNIHRRIQDVQGKKPEYRQICRWTDSGKPWVEWVPGGFAKESARNEKIITKRGGEEE